MRAWADEVTGLCSQNSAAFCAAGIDDGSTTFGAHTSTKTVSTFTLDLAWLKRTFHNLLTVNKLPQT
jgi:hypothetical protein